MSNHAIHEHFSAQPVEIETSPNSFDLFFRVRMTLRVLISLALWGRVLAATSKCPSGNCDDDNVLMQAGI